MMTASMMNCGMKKIYSKRRKHIKMVLMALILIISPETVIKFVQLNECSIQFIESSRRGDILSEIRVPHK